MESEPSVSRGNTTMAMKDSFIVTGGAGFIGSNIVEALARAGCDDVVVVDELDSDIKRRNLDSLTFRDYLDKADFREAFLADKLARPATVIHMGACSSTTETDEEYLRDNNYMYTRRLCEWCLAGDARFIYASSAATYGDGSLGYSDEDEVTPTLQPLNFYGKSKQMFDVWALENGLLDRITGLKYFNVYGPREDHKGDMRSVVHKAYGQVLEAGELGLFKSYRPDYADGEQVRDFVYVADAVKETLFFHENRGISGIFNCGTGTARTWLDLARAVFAAMGREPNINFIEMPEALRERYQYHTQADLTKLRRAGYDKPFMSIEDGVRDYVRGWLAKQSA